MNDGTGFAAFALYNALKTHFTSSSYDYFRYNGKTNVSKDTFMKRKDKYSFYKLSRKYSLEELRNFFVANFIYGSSTWVGEMTGPDGEDVYKKWQKTNQSLAYVFNEDVVKLVENGPPDEMLKVVDGQHPFLLTQAMSGSIKVETMAILNDMMKFFPMWNKKITDDIIWPNVRLKCEKYTPFIQYDKTKFKSILKDAIQEYA